jgi:RNA polymerase sigma-54 factor
MRIEAHLSQRQEMRMRLAPQIIQSIEILQLPILDLIETIKAEIDTNPTLEESEEQVEHEERKQMETPTAIGPESRDAETTTDDANATVEMLDRQREDDWSTRTRGSGFDPAADKKMEALMNTPAKGSSLRERLIDQWRTLDLPEKTRRIGEYVIYSIDDSGYLSTPMDSLTDATGRVVEEGLQDGVNRELRKEADEFVDSVRKLDPGAFGGKSVRRQVMRRIDEDDPDRGWKMAILEAMSDGLELDRPLEDVLAPHTAAAKDMYEALGHVQRLEPRGVGARNTKECLLLQLDREDDDYEIKRTLIEKHLEDIADNKLPKIAKDTERDIEEIKEIIQQIRTMNPKPGGSYTAESVPVVMPDVIVDEIEGEYQVTLEDGYIPRLCISSYYRDELAKESTKPEAKEYIRRKIESAKRLISSIEQRQATLFRIATELVRVQKEFFDHGISHLKPLRMQEIADALSLHVSTVSRAISDKYIQTPRGIFPMKFFFSGATESSQGEAQSRVSVQERIRELVSNEDHANPLSDGEIVSRLKAEGLDIARRTVTKYRVQLKIASSRQRKQF